MTSTFNLCLLASIIKCIISFDDIPCSNFSVHSSVIQDSKYLEYGYSRLFSGLYHLESDLLDGRYTDMGTEPGIMITGHVWGKIVADNHLKKRDTRRSKLSKISKRTGMSSMASVSDLEILDKVNPRSKVKRDDPINCNT